MYRRSRRRPQVSKLADLNQTFQTLLDTRPTYDFDSNATYVIAGGLGGLGRSIARWIIRRGARNLILLSRSGPKTEPAEMLVRDLAAQGARVATPACDITDASLLKAILRDCALTMPPIKGCIQASMVLKVSPATRRFAVINHGKASSAADCYIRTPPSRK